ncbi:MAG: efflux RND transporter permease subunit [Clostridiales bacterium]|nr:efflux RND transporter permease subunit [Clostridiales bacterium]
MLTKLSIKRPVTTIMVILMVFLGGMVAYRSMELAYMPSTDTPMIMVMSSYSGCGPEEMESLVTEPIEETLATLTDVDTITSSTSLGSSRVMVEFVEGVDLDQKTNDIRDKLDRVSRQLPEDADEPSIMKMDMNQSSTMIGVTSDKMNSTQLYTFVEDKISPMIERVSGVASVEIMGGNEKEIRIIVSPEKLKGYGISISTISSALKSENINTPAGSIQQGNQDMDMRAVGEFESIDEIKNLPIATSDGHVIHISDVAKVEEVEKEKSMLSLINGEEGIMISATKQSDANVVTVTDNLLAAMSEIESVYPELHLTMMTNTADYIKTSINNVVETAFQSAFIAVFVLLLFLRDWKSSLIIGVSIPTSIMATFGLMYCAGMTMNTISMGGIVIGIGMLVDNSVVVLENINTYYQRGYGPYEAAEKGTVEVAMAVTASTLTSVAVFGPLIFVTGMIGTMLKELSFTICFALLASLIVSLTFVPMASSRLLSAQEKKTKKKHGILTYIGGLWLYCLDSVDGFYRKVLQAALRHKITTIFIVMGCFLGSLCVVPMMGMDLMSSTDESACSISIDMPNGTVYEKTQEMLYEVMETVGDIPETETMYAMVRGSGSASINYNLVDKEERTRSTDEIVNEIQKKIENIAGAEISVSASSNAMGSMGGVSNLNLKITGPDSDTLNRIANDIIEKLNRIEGAEDLESSMEDSVPEVTFKINRDKAAKYGVSTSSIASTINSAVKGVTASTYKKDGTEEDIIIMYDPDQVKYLEDIKNITITTSSGAVIPITEVAEINVSQGAISISRENQQRYITISGNFQGYDTGSVQMMVEEQLNDYVFPDNYSYSFGGNMEMMNDMFSNLSVVMLVAVLLVYMIMASQFESILYPFIVMFSMPLAITGGIVGLFMTGMSITTTAMMGFIMLVGMVVNNAIVLVDYTNQLRIHQNKDCEEALLEAGPSRLRPILMTTLTTIIGLVPMAVATSSGMETQQPLGIAVIFGLSISTVITLILIPVLYSIVNNTQWKIKQLYRKWIEKYNSEEIIGSDN